MIRNLMRNFLSHQKTLITVRNKATATSLNEKDIENLASEPTEVLEEDEQAHLEEIERKRNKSRLQNQHRNLLHDKLPYPEAVNEFHKTVKYQRKMFAVYGNESKVNPGICWPTSQEIADIKEYEKIAFPHTIQELMSQVAQKRQEIEKSRQEYQENIVKKHAKLEQWKKEVRDKVAKKEADALAAKIRKDRMIEEVRRHFGFKIDPKDERFKEMLEQKERAEKKSMKEAKRKMKEAKLIAKLQEKEKKGESTEANIEAKDNVKSNEKLD